MTQKIKFTKSSTYGAGRVDANILICCRILTKKTEVVLPVIEMAEACGLTSKTTVIREIENFVKRGLLGNKVTVQSKKTIHKYNTYDVVGSDEDIITYNREVIDKYNNSLAVRKGISKEIAYPEFTWEFCKEGNLLVRKHSPRNRESSNAKYCEELLDSGVFDHALDFIKKYSQENPNLYCNGWISEGLLRFSNRACNTSSDFKSRKEELKKLDPNAKRLHSYDSNASIVRTAYFLTHDKPEDFNVDIYKILIHNVGKSYNCDNETIDALLSDKEFRKQFKRTVLPVFMRDYGTPYMSKVCKHIVEYIQEDKIRNQYSTIDEYFNSIGLEYSNGYYMCYETVLSLISALTGEVEPKYKDFDNFYNEYKTALINYCHSNWFRKKIFVWESLHHIYMMEEFTNLGYTVYNIYDEELIVGKLDKNLYERVWLGCAKKVRKDYHAFIAYYQEKHYSQEKVQKKCEKVLQKQEKIKNEITDIMNKHNVTFETAEKEYLSKNNMYKDGYLYRTKQPPRKLKE